MNSLDVTPAPANGKWKRRLAITLSSVSVIAVCVAIRTIGGRQPVHAENPAAASSRAPTAQNPNATSSQQEIVATINREDIHRNELAQACLTQYGKEVLDTLINKSLILGRCEQQGIKITKQDIDEEIKRLAKQFSVPVDQWLQSLKQERGIKPEQYQSDIILPMLALRRLAATKIQPTEREIDEAFESRFGEAVDARLIVLDKLEAANKVLAQAKAKPEEFGVLARTNSKDFASASMDGRIQPIRRFVGDTALEQAAFQLKNGEISPVVEVKGQFVILKCEGRIPPAEGVSKDKVRDRLVDFVRERKMRTASEGIFKELHESSKIVNAFDDPEKRKQLPGIAASVNGKTITMRDLAEACIDRHGEEVLDVMINRKLLEQELKRRNIAVTKKALDDEIARAAIAAGQVKAGGQPNVEGWLKMITDQGVDLDRYRDEAVWPSTALKLLAGDAKVTDDDIKRGFQANYGPKAEVRVIVLDNQRRAQEVWQKTRTNSSVEFFGKLAEEYSIEPASRANQGRVPPIRQFGGQPELQDEVFNHMKPGQISGIIQMADKFVIVYLENFTKPIDISMAEAKSFIYEDVHEKKVRMQMTNEFDRIKDEARIDNYLTGASQSPKPKQVVSGAREQPGANSAASAQRQNGAVPAAYETTGLLERQSTTNPSARAGSAKNQPAPSANATQPGSR
jgi:parvulin-like peptidyl-prolyl isomerase